ncbi:hypothetical protein MF672_039105 [Actinomadura sp. ATCC 31491]|uniref:N-acetyltransferase n=1 Tax=Actinomadura luzonensis TaxID=2805427 RepID=A0ABT0G5H5_9ACTN|nr:hypothetical protein [Actinomadura luzonensis]MCK2219764.1 hypothetical protein [Actinomadura luzonensis]
MTVLSFPNRAAVRPAAAEDAMHFVTIEPVTADDPEHYTSIWDTPPRLHIAEHRPGWPVVSHGTEGWIALAEMPGYARRVAARVGAEYVEPVDALAVELLGVSA